MMKAVIDAETCIGCGLCEQLAPDVFKMEEDKAVVAIADDIPEDQLTDAQSGAEQCPVTCITIS